MRVFVHIGTHKTGSTTIQAALANSADDMLKAGYVALPTPFFSRLRDLMLLEHYDHELAQHMREEWLGARVEVGPLGEAIHSFIISSEGFAGNPNTGYANSGVIARVLAEVFAGDDASVVVYLRSQDSFIESMYTQKIHAGGTGSFESYFKSLPDNAFDWKSLIRGFESFFGEGKVKALPFHPSVQTDSGSLVRSFAHAVGGAPLSVPAASSEKNRGYSRSSLELARRLNPALSDEQKWTLRLWLQAYGSKGRAESYNFFSQEDRTALAEKYSDANEFVASKHFERKWAEIYTTPVGSSAVSEEGSETNAGIEALMRICLELGKAQKELGQSLSELRDSNAKLKEQTKALKEKLGELKTPKKSVDKALELSSSPILRFVLRMERLFTRSKPGHNDS